MLATPSPPVAPAGELRALVHALESIAAMTYDSWTNGAKAGEIARAALSAQQVQPPAEPLHTFLNAAAGEGLVLDGIDAADLYVALFPERYREACSHLDGGTEE